MEEKRPGHRHFPAVPVLALAIILLGLLAISGVFGQTQRLLADKAYLEHVYRAGAEKAEYIANKTLRKVYKKVGFLPPAK